MRWGKAKSSPALSVVLILKSSVSNRWNSARWARMTKRMRKPKKKAKTADTNGRATAALAVALLVLLACLSALAQKPKDYALIYGTVWNADNRAVPGVPVKIQRVGDKKPKWEL